MMDFLRRDELFKEIRMNEEKYKKYIEQAKTLDEDYQKYFPKDNGSDAILKYNIMYLKALNSLKQEKDVLDEEWITLRKELNEFVKCQE